jgi:hypothetical protein
LGTPPVLGVPPVLFGLPPVLGLPPEGVLPPLPSPPPVPSISSLGPPSQAAANTRELITNAGRTKTIFFITHLLLGKPGRNDTT